MSVQPYRGETLHVTDQVRCHNEINWGEVQKVESDAYEAYYDEDDTLYSFDSSDIKEYICKHHIPPTIPGDAAGAAAVVTKPAAALNVPTQDNTVRPMMVVVCPELSRKHKMDPNRLWVVLNWRKNSKEQYVNIAPLNGDPTYEKKFKYSSVGVGTCKVVKFKSLVKG